MSESWKPVENAIKKFRRHLSVDFPSIKMEHAIEMSNVREGWKRGVRNGAWQRSGVYLIYDIDGKLLYVGSATATFNKRVLKNFYKIDGADNLVVIPFPHGHVFMANALEAFLIGHLRPPVNICGINSYVKCDE